MAAHGGPDIPEDGLQQVFDIRNRKSYSGSGSEWSDPITKTGLSTPGDPDWANNIDEITILMLLRVDGHNQTYAYHPVYKWNNGYNRNASFVLYHFQHYQGISNSSYPSFRWYGNKTAENNTGWGSISGAYSLTEYEQNMYFVGLQRNATEGGQLWVDGQKIGSKQGTGILGQTSLNSVTSSISIDGGPQGRGGIHGVEWIAFWNRELSDDEIIKIYQTKKGIINDYYDQL